MFTTLTKIRDGQSITGLRYWPELVPEQIPNPLPETVYPPPLPPLKPQPQVNPYHVKPLNVHVPKVLPPCGQSLRKVTTCDTCAQDAHVPLVSREEANLTV